MAAANPAAIPLVLLLSVLLPAAISAVPDRAQTRPGGSSKSVGADAGLIARGDLVLIVRVTEGDTRILPVDIGRGMEEWPRPQAFQAGADWLKNLTLVLRNTSQKHVTSIEFRVAFPQTGEPVPPGRGVSFGNYTYAKYILIGQRPARYVVVAGALHAVDVMHPAPYNPADPHGLDPPATTTEAYVPREADTTRAPIDIAPGQELSIPLAPYLDEIEKDFNYADAHAAVANPMPFASINSVWIAITEACFPDHTRWTPGVFYKPDPSYPGPYIKWMPTTRTEFDNITAAH